MSIPVEGGYRSLIATTLLDLRRRQAQVKALTEELEALAMTASSLQNVNLAEFHLDVDKLEFTERPKPPQTLDEHIAAVQEADRIEVHKIKTETLQG